MWKIKTDNQTGIDLSQLLKGMLFQKTNYVNIAVTYAARSNYAQIGVLETLWLKKHQKLHFVIKF